LFVEGQESTPDGLRPQSDYTIVTPDYFATLQIPLLQGRQLNAQDKRDAPLVIVINDTLAARLWPGQDPIGKRLRVGFEEKPREVVGVVGTIKQTTLDAEEHAAMYLPHLQSPKPRLTLLVRTHGEPLSMAAAVRQEVRAIDKDVPSRQCKRWRRCSAHRWPNHVFRCSSLVCLPRWRWSCRRSGFTE
jgi:putative ABC transport system permease protein